MEIFRRYRFEAAHRLPHVAAEHKCARLHGHSYQVTIHVRGPLDPDAGWVVDFAELDTAFAPVRSSLDHRCLNDVAGLENPTSENLARWIWDRLHSRLTGLICVVVEETRDGGASYRGPRSEL